MKSTIFKLSLISILRFLTLNLIGQTFEIRITESEEGYMAVQMRETSGTGTPSTTIPINDISFEIRWLTSESTDVDLICSNNDYNLVDGLGAMQTSGSYNFRVFQAMNTPFYPPNDWTQNQWETLATFKSTSGSGTADFEISPNGFGGYDLNWNQGDPPVDYLPTINGSLSNYDIPTLIYTYVWTGAAGGPPSQHNGTKWENTANWEGTCSGDSPPDGSYPYYGQTGSYLLIPSGLTNYPERTTGGDAWGWACNKMLIENGAHVTVPDLSGNTTSPARLDITDDIIVKGKLYLPALGYATVGGSTEIDNAEGIEVQASSSGVGSFIDNGTITYGSSGTGKAQTYLSNGAGAGSFYMHLVGPTLDDENYTGSGTGAFLGAFNVANGSTYAYTYDQGTGDWDNINSTTYEVHTADGIGLSTTDATAYTMSMSGEFITGNVTHSVGHGGTNNELISNPYPSAIDFDAFATDASNSGVIANKNWLWDPSSGNYLARSGGSGGQQYIQVGQAFFVETTAAGSVTFKNSFRTHSDAAFRDVNPNELTMKVSGGEYGFKDELVIRFVEDATSGYDPAIDAYKISSMYEDATQIESIAEDGSELSINFLPVAGLSGDMVSVPVHFQCGYSGEYTFDFEGIETFEDQNEIWLEDKKDNNNWIYLNNNPHYTFTAVPYEPHDRFILHFFGPTGIDENSVDNPVDIYSYRQYVYIKKNEPNEVIKKVSVYNINGEELFSKRVPDQPVNKLWVSEQVGYYLVRVITDKNSYTGKVFIFK